MDINRILVIFKTHLDIGFTDFAADVTHGYINNFIPSAIRTAEDLRERNSEASFRWTTGSWLIEKYFDTADENRRKALADAINRGDICWHALPFTTHTELMSKELFEYGLSISKNLDKEFGKKTVAAKMTDVPGHTKAMIPLLAKAGIKLLHIGVNPASAVPEVPPIFRWRADSGEEIAVIYNGDYGEFTKLGETGTALYFAHANDNLGAQSADEVEKIFAAIKAEYPDAEVTAADLNDAAQCICKIYDTLPVVTSEIGDSWIHGTGTDPKKVSQFRALQRIMKDLPSGKDRESLCKGLIMIPEHTWGLDEKTHLHDNKNYTKSDFYAHRNDENYRKMEKSWSEQRQFMYDAVDKLSPEIREKCYAAMIEYRREEADISGMKLLNPGEQVKLNGCVIAINENGAISYAEINGKAVADGSHTLFKPMYEQFSYDEYIRLHEKYHRIDDDWAIEDFTKIGMECASDKYYSCKTHAKAYSGGNKIIVKYKFSEKAVKEMGAPKAADAVITFQNGKLLYDFAWHKKDANRIAEAIWLSVNPAAQSPEIGKLGSRINPYDVVSKGNRNLHATDSGVYWDGIKIDIIDSALVSPGYPHLVDFVNRVPEKSEPLYFNLYNNVWGTNFPMWYDEDARFRFIVEPN